MQDVPMNVDEDSITSQFEIAYVRSVSGEPKLTVKLTYQDPISGIRQFNFLREKAEVWGKFSQRIANNIRNGPGKKKKKGKKPKKGDKMDEDEDPEDQSPQTKIAILTPTSNPIDSDMCTDEALQSENVLCIGDVKYLVKRNAATLTNLRIPKRLLFNCPIVAEVTVEFCDAADCQFQWFVATSDSAPDAASDLWASVSKDITVTFNDLEYIGKWVKVTAVPCNADGTFAGIEQIVVSKRPIEAGPSLLTPIRRRHQLTERRVGAKAFRIVSYNILADFYADSDHSRDYLYPYCPPDFLDTDYRRQLMLWELLGYNADILCLQEVDEKLYSMYLKPVLCKAGNFDSCFLVKRMCSEGVAVFYRQDKFEFVKDCSLPSLSTALYEMEDDLEMTAVVEGVKRNEKFTTRWSNLRQGLLTPVFRCLESEATDPQFLIVATSHFYFHPTADHMRLLQGIICLKHLARVKRTFGERAGVILAGDFNTAPTNALCEITTIGKLRNTMSDWYSCGREEYIGSPELNFDITFSCAYDMNKVQVTNYVAGYRGKLDYIFYTDELQLEQAIPLPSMEEITAKIALPNEYFPSDHLALVSDFLLK